jgi:hypothetical protein
MKELLFFAIFAASTLAQARAADLPTACGPTDVRFEVKLDKSKHTLAQPEPGKAVIYFFQDTAPPFAELHFCCDASLGPIASG